MPHSQDAVVANSHEFESTYECLRCGTLVTADTHPVSCECGGDFQNHSKSLE